MQKIAGFITSVHAVIERLRETGEISLHKEEGGKPGLKVKPGDAPTGQGLELDNFQTRVLRLNL